MPPADLAALPDGAGNVQASVSNINGNSARADRAYSVDATAPLITINTIASDDTLNVSEAGAGITISGTTTAQAGQTLTVTLNNNTYQTTILADGTERERSGNGFKRINRQQLYRDCDGERQSEQPGKRRSCAGGGRYRSGSHH